ncbi:hypothetical protein [Mycobacterium florentinum]|nr:hypothetical protein [Mycobacterium florentinum]MCV7408657.1 hypothetical protein [Mycobacterium florentinum]
MHVTVDLPDDGEQVMVLNPNPGASEQESIVRAASMCPSQTIRISY